MGRVFNYEIAMVFRVLLLPLRALRHQAGWDKSFFLTLASETANAACVAPVAVRFRRVRVKIQYDRKTHACGTRVLPLIYSG